MKYSVEILIHKPIAKVIELFDNSDNMSKWMNGLQSYEHLDGEPGQTGAKMKLYFKMGKREVEMIETILVKNLPDEFTASYEAKGVYNIVKNKFVPKNETITRYITEQEFQFKGFMKIMGALMPGAFKKQSKKYLNDFKKFAESN